MLSEKNLTLLSQTELFRGTSKEEIKAMLCCLMPKARTFAKGEYIWHNGERTDSLGVILEGNALIVQEDFWGNRNIIANISAGMSFGESFACSLDTPLNNSVIVQTDATIVFLAASRILTTCSSSCAHHNRIIHNLVADLARKNIIFNEKMKLLGERSTRAKLLAYLSQEALRAGSASFTIPFSRQQLADYLSVERSGLSVELSKLQKEGLLEYERNTFTLHQIG